MSNERNKLSELFRDNEPEHVEPQAGSRGLSVEATVERYLVQPGQVLSISRFFGRRSIEDVAKRSGEFDAAGLRKLEQGAMTPNHRQLVDLARCYEVELRVLLEAYGHVASDASEGSLGLAAQSNDTLTPDEKLDLERLVTAFRQRREQE